MARHPTKINLANPRYWPSWLGVGMLRVLSLLPLPMLSVMGSGLGRLILTTFSSRRKIAAVNISLCLPELSPEQQARLVREHFIQLGRSLLSTGVNLFARAGRLERLFRIEGREIIDELVDHGENIILLTPHFVSLEIGGIYLSRLYPTISMYQFIKNPVIDRVIRKGRSRFGIELVERREAMLQLVRKIRSGKLFYYLPDQDPGPRKGIFVPFFGNSAATYPMLSKFSRLSRAKVVPCVTEQLDRGRGWIIRILPPLDGFPTDDEYVDTMKMNQVIESMIRELPSQYFWVHKRFKTRPDGLEPVY
jgi:KDO2-lipid IV(A) lauroyltransferase